MNEAPLADAPGRPGVSVAPLFKDGREDVRQENWAPGVEQSFQADGGAELLILNGGAEESGEALRRHSWLRVPDGGAVALKAGPEGARIWIKTGHLRHVAAPTV